MGSVSDLSNEVCSKCGEYEHSPQTCEEIRHQLAKEKLSWIGESVHYYAETDRPFAALIVGVDELMASIRSGERLPSRLADLQVFPPHSPSYTVHSVPFSALQKQGTWCWRPKKQ